MRRVIVLLPMNKLALVLFGCLVSFVSFTPSALACSCANKAPLSALEATKDYVKTRYGASIFQRELIFIMRTHYHSSLFEKLFADTSSCWSYGPNKEPIYHCRSTTDANYMIQFTDRGCDLWVRTTTTSSSAKVRVLGAECN